MIGLGKFSRVKRGVSGVQARWRLFQVARQVMDKARLRPGQPPVAFFIASTRLSGMSLNSAFAFLTACGLQLAGVPVVYFACQAGMSPCVLGTSREDLTKPPPCAGCTAQSRRLFAHAPTVWFNFRLDEALEKALRDLSVDQLSAFEHRLPEISRIKSAIPLGELTLPSLRWALRRHQVKDDEPTRFLLRQYILSAWRVAIEFTDFLESLEPSTVVVFNGILYPEATARWVAKQRGLRVVTHEVGFRPFSGFFTDGQATAYPIHIPQDFELSPEQNARLDVYLEQRFQGDFSMAGIRFWPEMHGLDEEFNQRAEQFKQIVPVFTNVVYDTSQVHANTVFPQMFAWLELVLGIIHDHPETLFVIRAHPDEMRPGKESRESVPSWIRDNHVDDLPNAIFVDSSEYLSSYELIQRAKFSMVYNSSIGLEAALLGKAVLCGGKARYTAYPTVFFPQTPEAYRQTAEEFLRSPHPIEVQAEFRRNARRFLYYQNFRASLPFGEYLEQHSLPGFVQLRPFSWRQLTSENSPTLRTLTNGIMTGDPFLLDEA